MLTEDSYCTIHPDDAVCSGLGPCVIRQRHSIHEAVLSAVSTNLKRCLLLLHAHLDIWSCAGTLGAAAGARGQCRSLEINPGLTLPFPSHQRDFLQGSLLDPSCQNQTGAGDYKHGLLIEDVH